MFETSVVHERTAAASRRVSVLSVSLAVHAAVIFGAVGVSIASVDFPGTAPDQYEVFEQVVAPPLPPPPRGNHDGNRQASARPQQPTTATPQPPPQNVAPTITPETVPAPDANPSTNATGPSTGEPADGGTGEPWGSPDGVEGGVGTDLNALPIPGAQPQPPVEEKVYQVSGEVRAPRIIHRVEPKFPQALIRAGVSGRVQVHCIIDKHGRVRDSKVVFSTQPMLNNAVLEAVEQWRFEPASLRGNPVDAYFDLTVQFQIRR